MGQESGVGGRVLLTKGLLAWGEIRLRLGEEQRKDTRDSH